MYSIDEIFDETNDSLKFENEFHMKSCKISLYDKYGYDGDISDMNELLIFVKLIDIKYIDNDTYDIVMTFQRDNFYLILYTYQPDNEWDDYIHIKFKYKSKVIGIIDKESLLFVKDYMLKKSRIKRVP